MPSIQALTATIFSLAQLLVTIQLVRRRKLREEHALLWLATSIIIFFLSVSPSVVRFLVNLFAVTYAPTLILALGLLFALVISLSHSVIITSLVDHNRDLAQTNAILEWRFRQLEKQIAAVTGAAPLASVAAFSSSNGAFHPVENENHLPAGEPPRDYVTSPSTVPDQSTPPALLPTAAVTATSTSERPRRVLVIGLDGATFDLIEPWVADGDLPALGQLMREGSFGRLRSVVPPMTAPAWTSFGTGTNPGKHGLYDWIARKAGTYRFLPVTAIDCHVPTIYRLLSDVGRRVLALNVPMTYPPLPVNGLVVSGLPAPSTKVTISYPPTLYQEIVDAIGDYVLYPDPGQAYSDAGVDAFLKRLYKAGDLRIKAFDYLQSKEKWDFAMMVFNGTDTVSHAMWKYMDPTHPLHEASKRAKYGNAIHDYYRFVDAYLGRVIETLDDDTTLVIMSDHGFGPFHKFIHVNNWLIKNGFMRLHFGIRSQVKSTLFNLGFSPMNVYDKLMALGFGALKREVVRGQGEGLLKTFFLSFDDVDWSRTRAYSLGNIGQINLNVKGREPFGCVEPGDEYNRVREEIIAQIAKLRDPQTGEEVVESIFRREEIYSGDQLERAADIIFIPRRLEYFGFGEYEFGSHKIIEPMKRGISGTHRMDGIFLAYGKAIRTGLRLSDANIVDLAPTIMHLMGESVPDHMDGRVLSEIFSDNFQFGEVIRQRSDWTGASGDADSQFTDEEAELLSERLRNLGYVG
jgi:predicted AlkP superfamily phosphohydrolase/phosphomutase